MSHEIAPPVYTHVGRALRESPELRETLHHIGREVKTLGGGKSFKSRPNWGVTVFWWNLFADFNRGKDLTIMKHSISSELPASSAEPIEIELGPARIYPNARQYHLTYAVRSEILDKEEVALRMLAEAHGYTPPPRASFHLSLGGFAVKDVGRYQPRETDDYGPLFHAKEVANNYRDELPGPIVLHGISPSTYL